MNIHKFPMCQSYLLRFIIRKKLLFYIEKKKTKNIVSSANTWPIRILSAIDQSDCSVYMTNHVRVDWTIILFNSIASQKVMAHRPIRMNDLVYMTNHVWVDRPIRLFNSIASQKVMAHGPIRMPQRRKLRLHRKPPKTSQWKCRT